MAIVYQATNLVTGERYIGRTGAALGQRISGHFYMAKAGRGSAFGRAIMKYGEDMFRFRILLETSDLRSLIEEPRLIAALRPEYNRKRGASGQHHRTKPKHVKGSLPDDWCLWGEEWRAVPGYEGVYEVSDRGRVRSLFRQRIKTRHGYAYTRARIMTARKKDRSAHLMVYLTKDGRDKQFGVHQLVAAAFIGPRPSDLSVLHKNDIADDNAPSNLYYGTQQQNVADRDRNGNTVRGVDSPVAKLTEDDIRAIRALRGTQSMRLIGEKFGVCHETVRAILLGNTWRHVGERNAARS